MLLVLSGIRSDHVAGVMYIQAGGDRGNRLTPISQMTRDFNTAYVVNYGPASSPLTW